jgi:hypothetical protein
MRWSCRPHPSGWRRRSHRHHGVALDGVGMAGEVPARLRPVRAGGAAQAAVRARAAARPVARGHDRRVGRGPAPDVGQPVLDIPHPYTWINSGGLGTMGFSVPAAIGAKVGMPDRTVWAVDGDGCFQMTAQELVTAATERIPVKVAILNNAYLGMVRQWQEMFYEERYSEVYLSPRPARLREVGRSHGLRGVSRRVTRGGGSRRSVRPTRSTTARSSSSSAPTARRRCSRWCLPVKATTRLWCRRTPTKPKGSPNDR